MLVLQRARDGEVYVTLPGVGDVPQAFPALVDPAETWNGHAVPRFRKLVVAVLVEWVNAAAGPEDETLSFDGATVLVHHPDYPDEPSRCSLELVNGTPRWAVGGYEWTWDIAD